MQPNKTIQVAKAEYAQTGESTKLNDFGMREMQAKAYEKRNSQYLLIKAPPASGKSRALMFIALDKLHNQGIKKVIVAVPEKSIGGSFSANKLTNYGFFADWDLNDSYNLCTPGLDDSKSKVEAFEKFMDNDEKILICTHATLRFAVAKIPDEKFNNVLLAIDEFHHVSADKDTSVLGQTLHGIMTNSNAHIVAMTGSYFRGDGVAVLMPEDEAKFDKVTYNYYQQLNGYTYLKSLGIGYHFYQGKYTTAIAEVLDTDKKTILHIPNVNAGESTKDKLNEVDLIIDTIGEFDHQDKETGVIYVKRDRDGKMIKIANLVDDSVDRTSIQTYLRNIKNIDDMDLIIALGMAKEGFDWPYCEQALTVGYRSSLTEIIQIIGRCTRDSSNKSHAQFTNLIAQPDAKDIEVKVSVNNMLKAITCSLLMEQVMAPHFNFKTKTFAGDKGNHGDIFIKGFKQPTTQKVKDILESDITDIKAKIFQDDQVVKALPGNIDPEVINKMLIPKIIKEKYPDLSDEEIEEIRQHVVADSVIKTSEIKEVGDKKFVRMADQFINIEDLNIDLIDKINPFQEAYEILSKSVTSNVLRIIQETVLANRIEMTEEEAKLLWAENKIQNFAKENNGKHPDIKSEDPIERRYAEAVIILKRMKAEGKKIYD
jgi:superfamily II DNA or RNA helicase